jgi:hypothetical protein
VSQLSRELNSFGSDVDSHGLTPRRPRRIERSQTAGIFCHDYVGDPRRCEIISEVLSRAGIADLRERAPPVKETNQQHGEQSGY